MEKDRKSNLPVHPFMSQKPKLEFYVHIYLYKYFLTLLFYIFQFGCSFWWMFQYKNLIYEMGSNFEVLQLIWAILSLPQSIGKGVLYTRQVAGIVVDLEIEYSKSNGPQIECSKTWNK